MTNSSVDKFEKKVKKHIYGMPQTIRAIFPAGFGEVALDEVKFILSNSWFPQKFIGECVLLKNEIRISNIHMISAIELLMRSQCLSDIQLVISEGKTFGKPAFKKHVEEIDWDFYLNKNMSVKITLHSTASHAFHESGLKLILSDVLKNYVSEVVAGENTHETTRVYAILYKNKLTMSISLAGEGLYKRGYREELSASAPLREDIAACCIRKALSFVNQGDEAFVPDKIFIPFSGTGTFAFELMQLYYHISPVLFARKYAVEKMPLFKQESFNYLLKKARSAGVFNKKITIECIDKSEQANASCLVNLKNVERCVMQNEFNVTVKHDDFLKIDVETMAESGNMFILLNPPYGIRLGARSSTVVLYKEIAKKINALSRVAKKTRKQMLGFVLCPDEETWSVFSRQLTDAKTETYHFIQGGLDVRVCQFLFVSYN